MANWYMLTVVGKDQPGIVAGLTNALYQAGCNLGETSMMRLGTSFTMMLMVRHEGSAEMMQQKLEAAVKKFELHLHIDEIDGELHKHLIPNMRISVYGADRSGIVASVTAELAAHGFNITDLESDVAGTEAKPIYIMHIEGQSIEGATDMDAALHALNKQGIEIDIEAIDTLIG